MLTIFLFQVVVGGDGGCGMILEHSAADGIPAMNMDNLVVDILKRQVHLALESLLLYVLMHGGVKRCRTEITRVKCLSCACDSSLAITVCSFLFLFLSPSDDQSSILQEASPVGVSQTTSAKRLLWNVRPDTIRDVDTAKHNIDR